MNVYFDKCSPLTNAIMGAMLSGGNAMEFAAKLAQNQHDCSKCKWKKFETLPNSWCYMFKNEPIGMCGQYGKLE